MLVQFTNSPDQDKLGRVISNNAVYKSRTVVLYSDGTIKSATKETQQTLNK